MRRVFLCLTILLCWNYSIKVEAKEIIRIPNEVARSCEKWGEEYGVCPEVLEAMCWHETRCRSDLENEGCVGMTQINPKYHAKTMKLLGVDDLTDYDQNIQVCAYTMHQFSKKENDLYFALMCWNSGTSRAKVLFDKGEFTKYAIEVSEEAYKLEQIHGKVAIED